MWRWLVPRCSASWSMSRSWGRVGVMAIGVLLVAGGLIFPPVAGHLGPACLGEDGWYGRGTDGPSL